MPFCFKYNVGECGYRFLLCAIWSKNEPYKNGFETTAKFIVWDFVMVWSIDIPELQWKEQ